MQRPDRLIGQRIVRLDVVDSTNTLAAAHGGDPANEGLVFVAEQQTAGRGRMGRTWTSPPGVNLLLSVLLFPPENLRRPAVLTVLAGVAVCDTIVDGAGLAPVLKWPNDVLVEGKKVCGILVEQGRGTVLGIGLNVNTPAESFQQPGLEQATSLAILMGKTLCREMILSKLLENLDRRYRDLQHDEADLRARWRHYSGLLGKQVMVRMRTGQLLGCLEELGFDYLILREPNGRTRRLQPEIVEHVGVPPLGG